MSAQKYGIREIWSKIYEYAHANPQDARKFMEEFIVQYESSDEIRKFVDDDVHLLSTLYKISLNAEMKEYAEKFKEKCYRAVLEDVKNEKELRYPLYLTFILENYEDSKEKIESVLNHLKPNDRNLIMLKLILENHKEYDEKILGAISKNYRKLKLKKSLRMIFGEKISKYFERFI